MTVASASRKVTYNGSGSTGPFTFSFRVLSTSDVTVTRIDADGTRTVLSTPADYAITLTSLGISGGSITLTTALASGKQLLIEGNITITQPTNYANQGEFYPETHETSFDRATIALQETRERTNRSLKLPGESSLGELFLPTPEAGKALVWNADEDEIVNSASTLEDVSVVAGAIANVNTVATNIANVNTVAGISANVTTVAGIAANVTTVAGISANVTTVAGNTTNINTVATNNTNINTVAGISGNVTTVAGVAADVTTVAGIDADVTTLAAISADVATVAANVSVIDEALVALGSQWGFDDTTTMADPGSGDYRLNNATAASATALAISAISSGTGTPNFRNWIATWDDSTTTVKGTLIIRKKSAPENYLIYNVTGSITDNTTWLQMTVAYVTGSGTISNNDETFIQFFRTGDKGADGAGSGDVSGPASATNNAVAVFDGTTGKLLKNSSTLITAVGDVAGPASSTADAVALFNGTGGKTIKDSAVTLSALKTEAIIVAIGDETTAITTGTAKVTFRMPYAFTLTAVRASLTTVSSSGIPTFDINEGGTTILSTKLTIDANEKTSTTAATAAVISDSALADDAEITIDVDTAGTGAAGAKIYLIGYKT